MGRASRRGGVVHGLPSGDGRGAGRVQRDGDGLADDRAGTYR